MTILNKAIVSVLLRYRKEGVQLAYDYHQVEYIERTDDAFPVVTLRHDLDAIYNKPGSFKVLPIEGAIHTLEIAVGVIDITTVAIKIPLENNDVNYTYGVKQIPVTTPEDGVGYLVSVYAIE